MGRIRKAYESKYRQLLRQTGARRLEQGISWLMIRARQLKRQCAGNEADALDKVWQQVRQRVARPVLRCPGYPRFLCDAGLGGLARWLRAAGYAARWIPDIGDDDLLRQARAEGEVILTTDSLLLERRVLRDGLVPCLWVSPARRVGEQLQGVLQDLRLPLRDPRCMACGGALKSVRKETIIERIPPRTRLWLDDYYLCQLCDRLFWHGTHWLRIRERLRRYEPGA